MNYINGQIAVTEDVLRAVPDAYDREVKRIAGGWYQPFAYKFHEGIHYWLFHEDHCSLKMNYLRALEKNGWNVFQLRH